MSTDRLGDRQPGADALSAMVEIVDGNSLIEVLAQENRKVFLRQVNESFLTIKPRFERIYFIAQFGKPCIVQNSNRRLRCKDLQRFDRGAIGSQSVAW